MRDELLKTVRLTRGKDKLRVRFYPRHAVVDQWCDLCKNWACMSDYYEAPRTLVTKVLKTTAPGKDVFIGCQRFPAMSAAVKYARQWVERK
jgi:hypothetical protein